MLKRKKFNCNGYMLFWFFSVTFLLFCLNTSVLRLSDSSIIVFSLVFLLLLFVILVCYFLWYLIVMLFLSRLYVPFALGLLVLMLLLGLFEGRNLIIPSSYFSRFTSFSYVSKLEERKFKEFPESLWQPFQHLW